MANDKGRRTRPRAKRDLARQHAPLPDPLLAAPGLCAPTQPELERLRALYQDVCDRPIPPESTLDLRGLGGDLLEGALNQLSEKRAALRRVRFRPGQRKTSRTQGTFERWFNRHQDSLISAYVEDMVRSADIWNLTWATERFVSAIRALALPRHLRGKLKPPRAHALPSADELLDQYEDFSARWRRDVLPKADRLSAALDAFPDVPHEVLDRIFDRPGRLDAKHFAKEALAAQHSCSVRKVETGLRAARKARQTVPSP